MKLVKFSVTNFRSITKAHKIDLEETCILIGKNNEGKSNLLRALNIAMNALARQSKRERAYISRGPWDREESVGFKWKRDFPIAYQDNPGNKKTTMRLEFELNQDEIDEFKKTIKSNLNGTLPIELSFGAKREFSLKVAKKGRGAKTLNAKSDRIVNFVSEKIEFNYIPAVRTERHAIRQIDGMVSEKLKFLETKQEYIDALKVIDKLQKPVLEDLASSIKESLNEFLPDIKSVEIAISDYGRRVGLRRDFDVVIDDGTPTNIEYKGDGVKSLATLGLLKNKNQSAGASIVAIEEPESHLHPEAIHQLNEIINSISDTNQVILTTHNPLFVDRENIKTNVIIDNGKAIPAKSIKQIRELLGVKASDNLVNASFVLVVEGKDDKIALRKMLSNMSPIIKNALSNNSIIIEEIGGASNLSYKLTLLQNALCSYYVLLDDDKAGKSSFQKSKSENLLDFKNCSFTTCEGMGEAEFEDCILPELYEKAVLDNFGVSIQNPKFRSNKKWSDRMRDCFKKQGKFWDDKVEMQLKSVVANAIPNRKIEFLIDNNRGFIDKVIEDLERIITKKK